MREADEPYYAPSGKPTRQWVCRCDCGNEITVLHNQLTAKKKATKSCGCIKSEKAQENSINLKGKRFGRLTVIRRVKLDNPLSNGVINGWLCKCDCGNEVVTTTKALRNAGVESCGCLLRDTALQKIKENVFEDVDGTRLTMLKATRPYNTNKTGIRGVYWSYPEQQYIAHITIRGKTIRRRCGKDINAAIQARKELFAQYAQPIIDAHTTKNKEDTNNDPN